MFIFENPQKKDKERLTLINIASLVKRLLTYNVKTTLRYLFDVLFRRLCVYNALRNISLKKCKDRLTSLFMCLNNALLTGI